MLRTTDTRGKQTPFHQRNHEPHRSDLVMEDHEKNNIPCIGLRPNDAAQALGVSRRKLHEITADQTSGIPVTRFGKVVLYPTAPLAEWLAKRAEKNNG